MLTIRPIPAFKDNYIWLLTQKNVSGCYVVDPGAAEPVLAVLEQEQLSLNGILLTHHHWDHTGGVNNLLALYPAISVFGSKISSIAAINQPLGAEDSISLFDFSFKILEIPGHTLDHIAYFCEEHMPPLLFCGDTLFAAGCGRLFEGTAKEMYNSLQKIAKLPATTAIYCGHEYTLKNLGFAKIVEPNNAMIDERISRCEKKRDQNLATLPSILSEELNTNPFLRCDKLSILKSLQQKFQQDYLSNEEIFAALRHWKDHF